MATLTLPATLSSVRIIGRFVLDTAEKAGLEEQEAYRLRQAVDEIATNAVIHGYQASGIEGELSVSAEFDEDKLTIVLIDSCAEFDPLTVPPPADLEWQPADRPAGGLGIFLALQDVDEFHHQWLNNQNHRTFVQHVEK